jgi:hypothetical protein
MYRSTLATALCASDILDFLHGSGRVHWLDHKWKGFYGFKYDLDQRFCRTHFDGRNVPHLQNANGPDASGELSIADHVSVLRLDYSPL